MINVVRAKKTLAELGLTRNEIEVYLCLLRTGYSSITEISKHSGVIRTSVYPCIEKLQDMGIVVRSWAGKRLRFRAESSEALLMIAEGEKKKWRTIATELKKLSPAIAAVVESSATSPQIEMFQGIEGMKRMRRKFFEVDRIVKKSFTIGSDSKLYGPQGAITSEQLKDLFTVHRRQIRSKMYTILDPSEGQILNPKSPPEKDFWHYKYLPTTKNLDIYLLIFGQYVAILQVVPPYVGILIHSSTIASIMLFMWQTIWDTLPEVEDLRKAKGLEA